MTGSLVLALVLVAAAVGVWRHGGRPPAGPALQLVALAVAAVELLLAPVLWWLRGAAAALEASVAAAALLVAVSGRWPRAGDVGAAVAAVAAVASLASWQLGQGEVSVAAGEVTDAATGELLGEASRSEDLTLHFAAVALAAAGAALLYGVERAKRRGAR